MHANKRSAILNDRRVQIDLIVYTKDIKVFQGPENTLPSSGLWLKLYNLMDAK